MYDNIKTYIILLLGIICLLIIWIYKTNELVIFSSELIIALIFLVAFRSYRKVKKELSFLREFHHLSQALDDIRQIDSDKPFQNILRALIKICGLDRAAFLKIDTTQERLVLVAVEGFDLQIVHNLDICCKAKCSMWELLQYKEPLLLNNLNIKTECNLLDKYFKDCNALLIPITRNEIKWGCIIADRISSQAPITDDDLLQLQILSDQIAITLQNHSLQQELLLKAQILEEQFAKVKKELEIAKIVQEGVLSKKIPNWNHISVKSLIKPARIISGDFIRYVDACKLGKEQCKDKACEDCFEHLPGIIIGDVCGKGIPAALVMAVVNSLFGEKIIRCTDPATIMKEVNLSLKEYLGAESRFNSSAFLGLYDKSTRQFIYCNAGHEFPIFYSYKAKRIKLLESTGTLLGLFKESEYKNAYITLEPNDRILFFTDGLLDFIEKIRTYNKLFITTNSEDNILNTKVRKNEINDKTNLPLLEVNNTDIIKDLGNEIVFNLFDTIDENYAFLYRLFVHNFEHSPNNFIEKIEEILATNQNLQEDDITVAILRVIS